LKRKHLLLVLFLLAFLSRFCFGLPFVLQGTLLERGNIHFVHIAENLLAGDGYTRAEGTPTAIYTPLFPLFLALLALKPWLVLLAQSILSACTALLVFKLGECFLDRRAGAVAALIYTFNLYLISSEVAMNDTNLYIFLLIACSYFLLIRAPSLRHCLESGLLLGLAFLARSMTLALVPGILLWVWLYTRGNRKERLSRVGVLLAGFCLCWLPWVVRNKITLGSPVLTSTWANVNLWKGNNEYTDLFYPDFFYDSLEVPGLGPSEELSEVEQEAWYRAEGLRFIRAHPGLTARRTLGKVFLFFHVRLIPYHKEGYLEPDSRTIRDITARPWAENFVYTALYIPIMLGLFWGFYRAWREQTARPLTVFTLILTGLFCLLCALTTYMTRYRLPVEPFFYLFTARGWLDGLARFRRTHSRQAHDVSYYCEP